MKQKKQTAGLLAGQKRIILILAVLVAVLAVIYAVFLMLKPDYTLELPLYDADGDRLDYSFTTADGSRVRELSRTDDTLSVTADSEITYTTRPFLYEEIPLEQLASVSVHNASGDFELYLDATGEYVFRGNEMLLYQAQALSDLRFQARYPLAVQKLAGSYTTDEALASFGLDAASDPIRVTATNTRGESCTLLLGDRLVTGAAYYAKNADKPYIYVLDSSVSVFQNGVNSYFTPLITAPISSNECNYIERFSIEKDGKPFLDSAILPEEQREGTGTVDMHRLSYPARYSASMTGYYDALACFENLSGSAVLETGVLTGGTPEAMRQNPTDGVSDGADVSNAADASDPTDGEGETAVTSPAEERAHRLWKQYGFDTPTNDVSYSYNGKDYRFLTGSRYTDENGAVYYYAYSPYMDTIVSLPLENAPFLEYDLLDFIDPGVYRMNINDVAELTAHIPGVTCRFVFTGTGADLKITEANTGRVMDTASFRQFFISLLSIRIDGYADENEATGGNEFGFTVTTKYGDTLTYEFDIISTTRDLITLDENAEFYANRSCITIAAERLMMLMNGETIKADY